MPRFAMPSRPGNCVRVSVPFACARNVHGAFVLPEAGVIWKMTEDLRAPYPGYGLGAMDAFDGYIAYRTLDADALAPEIAEMRALMVMGPGSLPDSPMPWAKAKTCLPVTRSGVQPV